MGRKLNIRRQLGKEQYELIQQRNWLHTFIDCSIAYGGCEETEIFRLTEELEELNKKIESLKLLRTALKQ